MENFIFIFFCLAVLVGMTVIPFIFGRIRAVHNPSGVVMSFRAIVSCSILCAVAGFFTQGYTSAVIQFLSVCTVSAAMNICLNRAVAEVTQSQAGRFIGYSFAAMAVFGAIFFFLPFAEIPTSFTLTVMCALLLVSAVSFDPPEQVKQNEPETELRPPAPRGFLIQAFAVLILYVIVSSILDGIYFFDEAFDKVPHFMFFILLYSAAVDAGAGYMFDKFRWGMTAAAAFLLICCGQSMSFFSSHDLLIFPYTIFSNAGNIALEVFLVALPVVYCAQTGRNGIWKLLPGLGYLPHA
jgi:hypothetical protein